MNIVFDTNIIQSTGFYCNTHDFKLLLSLKEDLKMNLFIPAVVLAELKDHLGQKVNDNLANALNLIKDIHKLLPKGYEEDFDISILQKTKADSAYLGYLLEEYDNELQQENEIWGNIIPYPQELSHKDVVQRIILGKAPFLNREKGKKEKGYKDYVLWRSLLEQFHNTKGFYFISDDAGFYDKDEVSLHPDLAEEAEILGFDLKKIRLYKTLTTFIDKELSPNFPKNALIFRSIQENKLPKLDLKKWCDKNLERYLNFLELDIFQGLIPHGYAAKNITLYNILKVDSPKLIAVYNRQGKRKNIKKVEPNIVEIVFEVHLMINIMFDIHNEDFQDILIMYGLGANSKNIQKIGNSQFKILHPQPQSLNLRISLFYNTKIDSIRGFSIKAFHHQYVYDFPLTVHGDTYI